jgi:hypothetical protein
MLREGKHRQRNVGQGNHSKETAFILLTHVLSTVFLFRIPLPNIPLPIPAFPTTILVLVAALPRCVLLRPFQMPFLG